MDEPSIHDNKVYAYVVRCDRREIILHTQFDAGTREEYTDVIFSGVVCHHFEDVLSANILFGIDEVDVADTVGRWADLFSQRKNYGWPDGIKYTDRQHLISVLERRGDKAFEISSSYGLSGWVLAQTMELRTRNARC